MVDNFRFYVVFVVSMHYGLMDLKGGVRIGDFLLVGPLFEGAAIILGGCCWRVTRVDADRWFIQVEFGGEGEVFLFRFVGGGGFLVHAEVRCRMWDLYCFEVVFDYLDDEVGEFLVVG